VITSILSSVFQSVSLALLRLFLICIPYISIWIIVTRVVTDFLKTDDQFVITGY